MVTIGCASSLAARVPNQRAKARQRGIILTAVPRELKSKQNGLRPWVIKDPPSYKVRAVTIPDEGAPDARRTV
eukprot:scaffold305_cov247-Pinguiococcus_pyrenoidosus.AAC.22